MPHPTQTLSQDEPSTDASEVAPLAGQLALLVESIEDLHSQAYEIRKQVHAIDFRLAASAAASIECEELTLVIAEPGAEKEGYGERLAAAAGGGLSRRDAGPRRRRIAMLPVPGSYVATRSDTL